MSKETLKIFFVHVFHPGFYGQLFKPDVTSLELETYREILFQKYYWENNIIEN